MWQNKKSAQRGVWSGYGKVKMTARVSFAIDLMDPLSYQHRAAAAK
jgi:hypothetical protein